MIFFRSGKSCNGFSLAEAVVALAVFSTAVVLILQSFLSCLNALKIYRSTSDAVLVSENKMWEFSREAERTGESDLQREGRETCNGIVYSWKSTAQRDSETGLVMMTFTCEWADRQGKPPRDLMFRKYLVFKKNEN
ncbi:MAG: hypothetical protein PHE58_02660 [Candidatus Omnitrophica bacterium]|nr:hypothetical protein [Candidatus Omnitrophota bacterium]